MVRKLMFVMVLVALLVTPLLACAEPTEEPTPTPTPAPEMKTFKYGVIGPQTGPVAFIHMSMLHGDEIAVEQINENGTLGDNGPGILVGDQRYEIEIVSYDDGFDPAKSVTGMRQLAEMHDIKVIHGPFGTPCTLAGMEVNVELGVLMDGMSGSDAVRKMGNPLYIQERLPVIYFGNPMADAAWDRGYKTVCIITDVSDAWINLGEFFKTRFEELGGEVLAFESVDIKTVTDYHSVMTSFKAKNPDAIFAITYDEPLALMTSHALNVGYAGKFMYPSEMGPKTEELVGLDRLEGAILFAHDWTVFTRYPEKDTRGVITSLVERAVEKYGEMPAQTMPVSHDVTYIFMRAIELAGTVDDPYAIRAAIPKVVEEGKVSLCFQQIACLDNGLLWGHPDLLIEIKDGEYQVIGEVLVPRELLE